jgi:hypothetical protein
MKILKSVSILIAIFGLSLGIFGAVILSAVDRNTRLLEAMQKEGMAQHIDAQVLRSIIKRNAIGYEVVGLLSLISGIGLFFRRRWALLLWLALVTFILGLIWYQFFQIAWHGDIGASNLVSLAATSLVFGAMGIYFLRAKTRLFFNGREAV